MKLFKILFLKFVPEMLRINKFNNYITYQKIYNILTVPVLLENFDVNIYGICNTLSCQKF